MLTEILRFFAIICVAVVVGKIVAKIKLPAILGWLITGIVFGPYLAQVVTLEITEKIWYKTVAKVFECFAGVMIGREIVFLNYLLIGMAYSATAANLTDEEKTENTMRMYAPILNISLVVVIVNLGMPLDYRLIAGAGLFTLIYIVSRAVGKIGGAYLGGKITKAEPTVTKHLGLTLLPHSGVSLVFTGIAVNVISATDAESAAILSGTIVAAAIINEIIAVISAKVAFKKSGEIQTESLPVDGVQ